MKTLLLDTNVIINDPDCFLSFPDCQIVIPLVVVEELDAIKGRPGETGRAARQACAVLDRALCVHDVSVVSSVSSRISVVPTTRSMVDQLPHDLDREKVDNRVLALALELKQAHDLTLVTNDINLRLKCRSLGINCREHTPDAVNRDSPDSFYSGVNVMNVEPSLVVKVFEQKSIPLVELGTNRFFPNQVVVCKGGDSYSALCRVVGDKAILIRQSSQVFGLKPRNKEQIFALDLLMEPEIKLLTLSGIAGVGKSILALAAGLEQLKKVGASPTYEKLVIMRPIQPVGRDIGYLPGNVDEKLKPWTVPIHDNLSFLFENKTPDKSGGKGGGRNKSSYFSLLQEEGLIEIDAITYVRGRSIHNAFMIIDECQNLSIHELKTIITRVGDGSKVVCLGDIEQTDRSDLNMYTNGLTNLIEKFKDQDIAGHISLIKGERSRLASLAASLL